jgi:hypothetical protein
MSSQEMNNHVKKLYLEIQQAEEMKKLLNVISGGISYQNGYHQDQSEETTRAFSVLSAELNKKQNRLWAYLAQVSFVSGELEKETRDKVTEKFVKIALKTGTDIPGYLGYDRYNKDGKLFRKEVNDKFEEFVEENDIQEEEEDSNSYRVWQDLDDEEKKE